MSQIALFDQEILGGLPPELISPLTEWEDVITPNRRSRFRFPQKKNSLSILLIGETGSGKTSFMSLLLNLFQGNGPFELREKYLNDAQSGLDLSQSQTTVARIYPFTTSDDVKVEVIDTPGLADTRGLKEDEENKKEICRAIKELVTHIDAVMILANGTAQRLTAATKYTLNIISTLFPRSIIENIGIIFTHTGACGDRLNFQMQSLPLELQRTKYWCLDNPLSRCKNYLDQKASGNLSEVRETRRRRDLKENYEETLESLDDWLEWLDGREKIPTTAIIQLYQKSSHIESRLFGAVTSMTKSSKLQCNLQHMMDRLGAADEVGDTAIIGGSCRAFKTFGISNKWLTFWDNEKVRCGHLAKCGHEVGAHRYYQKIHKYVDNEAYTRLTEPLQAAIKERYELERHKRSIGREIERAKHEIERLKREISELVEELNSLSLNPNFASCIGSALEVLKLRKAELISRPDSTRSMRSELAAINGWIKDFEARLNFIRESAAGRVVGTAAEPVGLQT